MPIWVAEPANPKGEPPRVLRGAARIEPCTLRGIVIRIS